MRRLLTGNSAIASADFGDVRRPPGRRLHCRPVDRRDRAVEAIISVGKPLFSAEQDTSELMRISRFTDRSSSAVIIQRRTGEARFAIAIRLQSAPRAVVARHS
ncbi:hypothetical protein K3U94_10860 [Mycolicibacter heraklionensis]|uniref:Uncharacterized protein n=1 Tax=Mycolicibacter heraklionensis TaxID=512402 RepID=A0A9X7WK10_9MYCO|nr:hypothetical protein [Mycolicibacter heraklionensis]QZA09671.1 hypothetical protein K3U94_10860 [Mycolicibacter heraklionensis]